MTLPFRPIALSLMLIGLLAAAGPAQANWWPWSEDHPSEDEIRVWIEETLRSPMQVAEIELRTQEMREGMSEHSETRVRAIVEVQEDLFRTGDRLSDPPYTEKGSTLIHPATPAGTELEVFGIARAVASGDGWRGEFEWDDSTIYRQGRRLSEVSTNGVLHGSQEHRDELEAMRRYREDLQAAASISVAGTTVCTEFARRSVYLIDKLEVDAAAGEARLVYRAFDVEPSEPIEERLAVEKNRGSESFTLTGSGKFDRLSISVEDGEAIPSGRGCDLTHLYPIGEIPEELQAARAKVDEFLRGLSLGRMPVDARGDGRPIEVEAEILEIRDHGFDMRITHPVLLNGRFFDNGRTSVSTIEVVFRDEPAGMRIRSSVEGRGDPVMRRHCGPEFVIDGPGKFHVDAVANYYCDHHYEFGQ